MSLTVLSVAGARPNFMKIGPIHSALAERRRFISRIVHTGQHYDGEMSDVFFRELELPRPDVHLGVGSGSHAVQTARVMTAFEQVLKEEDPDAVIVVGDVNSTLACALVAAKLHVPVAHVEAGLRSFDERMPEEINRRLTDQLARWLFVTEQSGVENLEREGVPSSRIHMVGNVMIDSLVRFRQRARKRQLVEDLGLESSSYVLMTMHRPSNVDDPEPLGRVVELMESVASDRPLVFPMHPRTKQSLQDHGYWNGVAALPQVRVLNPVGYLDFLHLMENAGVVVTDSGGIQEETTYLGVPCITVRENTERPATIEVGTNELSTLDAAEVSARVAALLGERRDEPVTPPLWDGRAAHRIVRVLEAEL